MRYSRLSPEYRMGDGNPHAHDERMERIVPPSGEYKSHKEK
jgi:hypothetical protein